MVDITEILNGERVYPPINQEIPPGPQTLRGVEIAAANGLYGGGDNMISRLVEIIKALSQPGAQEPGDERHYPGGWSR